MCMVGEVRQGFGSHSPSSCGTLDLLSSVAFQLVELRQMSRVSPHPLSTLKYNPSMHHVIKPAAASTAKLTRIDT